VLAAAALLCATVFCEQANAQICSGFCPPPPTPRPSQNGNQTAPPGAGFVSAQAGLFDVATQFMQTHSVLSTQTAANSNPQGGGADTPDARYRTWFEGYGLGSHTDPQGDFPGDHRRTLGAVAGAGVTVAPGVTVGLSVDQSRSKIDVTSLPQRGTIDLTQIGALGSFVSGPWQLSSMAIYGFGRVHSERVDTGGAPVASYGARLWAAMAELSYYVALPDNSRLIPRLTFDGTWTHTDAFVEAGGAVPIAGSAVSSNRGRMMLGGEFGHTWLAERTIMDFLVYARFVDNFVQNIGMLQVSDPSGGFAPQTVLGVRESTLGADAGAALSARLNEGARVYLLYDGRFRSNFTSHSGTLGAEFRF